MRNEHESEEAGRALIAIAHCSSLLLEVPCSSYRFSPSPPAVVLIVFVIEAIRRDRLNVRYAILWLGSAGSSARALGPPPAARLGGARRRRQLPALAALPRRLPLPAEHRAALLARALLAPRLDPPPDADDRAARSGRWKKSARARRRRRAGSRIASKIASPIGAQISSGVGRLPIRAAIPLASSRHWRSEPRARGTTSRARSRSRRCGRRSASWPCRWGCTIWSPPASLAVLIAVVYAPSLEGPFVFDDANSIGQSELVRSLTPLWRFVVLSTRPLADFSFAVDYAIDELRPRAYHATNILLHILNVVLAYLPRAAHLAAAEHGAALRVGGAGDRLGRRGGVRRPSAGDRVGRVRLEPQRSSLGLLHPAGDERLRSRRSPRPDDARGSSPRSRCRSSWPRRSAAKRSR